MISIGDMAQLVAAIGVILSMLNVARQIKNNTKQAILTNWGVLSERYMSVYRQGANLEFADVIVRGHENYDELTNSEKIAFGFFLENACIANEGALVMSKDAHRDDDSMVELFNRHIRWHIGSKGGRRWFEEFERQRAFPSDLSKAIHLAIASSE
mgnify:FL=1